MSSFFAAILFVWEKNAFFEGTYVPCQSPQHWYPQISSVPTFKAFVGTEQVSEVSTALSFPLLFIHLNFGAFLFDAVRWC